MVSDERIKRFCKQFDECDITQDDITDICALYNQMILYCGGPYRIRGGYRRALQVVAIDRILSGWNERWYAYYKYFDVRSIHFSTLFRRYPKLEYMTLSTK